MTKSTLDIGIDIAKKKKKKTGHFRNLSQVTESKHFSKVWEVLFLHNI